jgi:hypothetical protein
MIMLQTKATTLFGCHYPVEMVHNPSSSHFVYLAFLFTADGWPNWVIEPIRCHCVTRPAISFLS